MHIRFFSILLFSFFASSFLTAQGIDFTLTPIYIASQADYQLIVTQEIATEDLSFDPFLAVSVVWESDTYSNEPFDLHLEGKDQTGNWVSLATLKEDAHSNKVPNRIISKLHFLETKVQTIRLRGNLPANDYLGDIKIRFYQPENSNDLIRPVETADLRNGCVCPQPAFLDRQGWCPSGDCPEDTTPAFTDVTHLIVHHTAGSNTSADWAARVRSIWDFHVNVNGWDDIGYNWLIDPNGVLYEGRGDDVRGAHFCGTNSNTMGIAMMGNFQTATATEEAKETLTDLLAWKSCDIDSDPLDTAFHAGSSLNLFNISGHRDGCATSCPGDLFYPELPDIRQDVSDIQTNECEEKLGTPVLTAEAVTNFVVNLNWEDNAVGEESYIVERSVGNNTNFILLLEVDANETSLVDNSVTPMNIYFYRVKAVGDAIIDSEYSNEATALTDVSSTTNSFINDATVQLSPNPGNGILQLVVENELMGAVSMEIFDQSGRQVAALPSFEKNSSYLTATADLTNLSSGMYFVQLSQNGYTGLFKIIIR